MAYSPKRRCHGREREETREYNKGRPVPPSHLRLSLHTHHHLEPNLSDRPCPPRSNPSNRHTWALSSPAKKRGMTSLAPSHLAFTCTRSYHGLSCVHFPCRAHAYLITDGQVSAEIKKKNEATLAWTEREVTQVEVCGTRPSTAWAGSKVVPCAGHPCKGGESYGGRRLDPGERPLEDSLGWLTHRVRAGGAGAPRSTVKADAGKIAPAETQPRSHEAVSALVGRVRESTRGGTASVRRQSYRARLTLDQRGHSRSQSPRGIWSLGSASRTRRRYKSGKRRGRI